MNPLSSVTKTCGRVLCGTMDARLHLPFYRPLLPRFAVRSSVVRTLHTRVRVSPVLVPIFLTASIRLEIALRVLWAYRACIAAFCTRKAPSAAVAGVEPTRTPCDVNMQTVAA